MTQRRSTARTAVRSAVTAAILTGVVAGLAQSPPNAPSQATPKPRTGTGLILGQVVDSTGAAISGALVTINTGSVVLISPRALTTSEGRFVFTGLPAGPYSISAQKPGYSLGLLGRTRPEGPAQSLELADGERETGVKITIWKLAAITGTLTDEAGEPLVGATVWSLSRSYAVGRSKFIDGPSATTDDRGLFRFGGLTAGDYAVCVIGTQTTMPATLVEGFAAARTAGTTEEFQRRYSPPTIGLNARVPTAGIRVGDAVLHTVGPYSGGVIPPAPGDDGQIKTFQTTCHSNAVGLKQAQIITLASGEDRTGVDIRLTPVPSVAIHGTVVGPDGPAGHVGLRLAADFAEDLGAEQTWEAALAVSDAQGRFTFLGVPPGTYTLRALKAPLVMGPPSRPPTSDRTLAANVPIVVGADGVADLTVTLGTGFRISGRFQFEGSRPKPPADAMQGLSVWVQPLDGHPIGYGPVLRARADATGTFSTYEIPPGRYFIRMSSQGGPSMAGWTYKASLLKGRDVGSSPLDLQEDVTGLVIALTDTPTEIAGTVRDESGRVDPTAAVVIFSAERADWSNFGDTPRRLSYARPSIAGRYRVAGLPPGQYLIVAVDDASLQNWQDPRVLDVLSRLAQRVTLDDREKKAVDVVTRVIR
jgi:hypothetical protein